jgi:hypothetical protein
MRTHIGIGSVILTVIALSATSIISFGAEAIGPGQTEPSARTKSSRNRM